LEIFFVSLCILGVSVVKIFEEELTTEARRMHRDTEIEIRTPPKGGS